MDISSQHAMEGTMKSRTFRAVLGDVVFFALLAFPKNVGFAGQIPVFNVKDFGATGCVPVSRTDDVLPIKNAINAAVNAGGGIVYLPAGEYHTGRNLIVPKLTNFSIE